MEQTPKISRPWRPVQAGIVYAIVFNLIIVLVPIAVGLLDIAKSSRPALHTFIESQYHDLAGSLLCYSSIVCTKISTYVFLAIVLAILTGVIYFISLRKAYSVAERKQLLTWFVVVFLFANYLMYYVMGTILFTASVLKFGFV